VKGLRTTLISILAIGLLAGSTVTAEDDADPMAAASVTGTLSTWKGTAPGEEGSADGSFTLTGAGWMTTWEATDPRLSGTAEVIANYKDNPFARAEIGAGIVSLENEGGRWEGRATTLSGEILGQADTIVMRGQGGYEGLTAYILVDEVKRTFKGMVFPGEMPPFPEPPAE
jgi:hypothetical protein